MTLRNSRRRWNPYEDSSVIVVGSKSDLEHANEVLRSNNEVEFELVSP